MFNITKDTNLKLKFPDGTVSNIDENVQKLISQMQDDVSNNIFLPSFDKFRKSADQYSEIFLKFYSYLIANHKESMSQLYQDLFVLFCLDQKVKGKFLEFTQNHNSNTLLLEKKFNWEGVLVGLTSELNRTLKKSRPNCKIINNYFSHNFNESYNKNMFSPPLDLDLGKSIETEQNIISVNDIFLKHFTTNPIDYMSIDIEGFEMKILEEFDFKKFAPTIITIKHHFAEQQVMLDVLLSQNNYLRFFKEHSQNNAWYVLQL